MTITHDQILSEPVVHVVMPHSEAHHIAATWEIDQGYLMIRRNGASVAAYAPSQWTSVESHDPKYGRYGVRDRMAT